MQLTVCFAHAEQDPAHACAQSESFLVYIWTHTHCVVQARLLACFVACYAASAPQFTHQLSQLHCPGKRFVLGSRFSVHPEAFMVHRPHRDSAAKSLYGSEGSKQQAAGSLSDMASAVNLRNLTTEWCELAVTKSAIQHQPRKSYTVISVNRNLRQTRTRHARAGCLCACVPWPPWPMSHCPESNSNCVRCRYRDVIREVNHGAYKVPVSPLFKRCRAALDWWQIFSADGELINTEAI